MPEKVIKAKNVVSFTDGEVKEQIPKTSPIDTAASEAETAVEAANAPVPEAIETKPLNLRNNRYLDDAPQDPDWADEEDYELETDEEEGDRISTFAEVFIPLHDDSTATVIRKGMVIVSVIVILCCLVAIFMKTGSIGGILTPDFTSLPKQTATVLSAVLSTL